jgi:hypothetical protein
MVEKSKHLLFYNFEVLAKFKRLKEMSTKGGVFGDKFIFKLLEVLIFAVQLSKKLFDFCLQLFNNRFRWTVHYRVDLNIMEFFESCPLNLG